MFSARCKQMVMVKLFFAFFFSLVLTIDSGAQTSASPYTFLDYQKSIPKVTDVVRRKEDTLMKQFEAKGLQWPARYVYIRSFKYDSQLEVWVKNERKDPYKLFKTYKICAMAG